MSDHDRPVENLSYEEALAELEKIVAALELEEQTLEKAISLYERGQELSRHCIGLLDRAELRVRTLGEPDSAPEE